MFKNDWKINDCYFKVLRRGRGSPKAQILPRITKMNGDMDFWFGWTIDIYMIVCYCWNEFSFVAKY